VRPPHGETIATTVQVMERSGTKEAAEALLRELPSVRGAYVREDVFGHPREIHILLSPGPAPRHFARDVRSLLEERLGIPVDQRVISIAQLAPEHALPAADSDLVASPDGAAQARPDDAAQPAPPWPGAVAGQASSGNEAATSAQSRLHDRAGKDAAGDESHDASSPGNEPEVANDSGDTGRDRTNPTEPRLRFIGTETSRRGGRLTVTARLAGWREEFVGSDTQVDSAHARLRSGARAILDAANQACAPRGRFELEDAARIRALGRDYVLLTVVAHAPRLGRRPLTLAGAHAVESEEEGAAALAALKAVNRVLALILADDATPPRRTR
jgi:hypothetical protein